MIILCILSYLKNSTDECICDKNVVKGQKQFEWLHQNDYNDMCNIENLRELGKD